MHINNQTIFQRFVLHSAALAQAFRDRVSGVTGEMVPRKWFPTFGQVGTKYILSPQNIL